MKRLLPLLYPALIGAGVVLRLPILVLCACLLLCVQLLAPALRRGRLWAWAGLAVIAALGLMVAMEGDGRHMMQMISLVISGLFMLLFGRSLRPGGVALASRVAAAARGFAPEDAHLMDPQVLRYTRRVTWMWTLVFGVFVIQSLWVTFYSVPTTLGLAIDIANFVLVVLLLGGEYLYHSRRYPNPRHKNFLDFARDVAQVDYGKILTD